MEHKKSERDYLIGNSRASDNSTFLLAYRIWCLQKSAAQLQPIDGSERMYLFIWTFSANKIELSTGKNRNVCVCVSICVCNPTFISCARKPYVYVWKEKKLDACVCVWHSNVYVCVMRMCQSEEMPAIYSFFALTHVHPLVCWKIVLPRYYHTRRAQ